MHLDVPTGSPRRALWRVATIGILFLTILSVLHPAGASAKAPKAYAARVAQTKAHIASTQRRVNRIHRYVVHHCQGSTSNDCVKHRARLARQRQQLSTLKRELKRLKRIGGSQTTSGGNTNPSPAPAPPSPSPSPAPYNTGWQPGLVVGSAPLYDLPPAQSLGAKIVRAEFSIDAPASALEPTIAGYASAGIRVLPLASFAHRIPSAAEAANLASWAAEFGPGGTFWANRTDGALAVQNIEFGNETSYPYMGTQGQGGAYALSFKAGAQAIKAANPNVGLLAQGDDVDHHWFDEMFQAVPDLGSFVAGWTIHPYGNWTSFNQGRFDAIFAKEAQYGAPTNIPIDATEWGLASDGGACLSDNYGWNPCMPFDQAASTLRGITSTLNTMARGHLRMFLIYRVTDLSPHLASNDREQYFGALTLDRQSKGAYTDQVKATLASTQP